MAWNYTSVATLCCVRIGSVTPRGDGFSAPNDMTSIDPERDNQLFNHRVGQLLLSGRNNFGKEVYDLVDCNRYHRFKLDYVDPKKLGAIGHSKLAATRSSTSCSQTAARNVPVSHPAGYSTSSAFLTRMRPRDEWLR